MARLQLPSADQIPGGRAWASLSRRVRTLIVSGILFIVLFVLVFTLPVPYVVLTPGPTCNTLGSCYGQQIIKISGTKVNKTSGNLNLTTVGVSGGTPTPFDVVKAWLAGDQVVAPRSAVYPPDKSQQQTDRQNTQEFVVSQDSAKVAALCELGYPKAFGVVSVSADGPSKGVLQTGDQLKSVDGRPANNADLLAALLKTESAGHRATVVVTRHSKPTTVQVTLAAAPKGKQGARFGIEVSTTCLAPFSIDLGLANQIGGPSAGLMFALGIMDKIGSQDLTKGRFVAGTGTIDAEGKVGPIGGIPLKMIAARDKGASVFLAPGGNCKDVRNATPAGLKVVKVETLHGAVQDLLKIEKGEAVPGC
ncbi:MAG: YlbL family protein [Jatrophihabitans sp.]